MKIIWSTDIHLDHGSPGVVRSFLEKLRDSEADLVLLTGDIAESQTVALYLENMRSFIGKPISFVLGNHDYYGGRGGIFPAMEETRMAVSNLSPGIHYLPQMGVCELSPTAALIGHDGWYDGEYVDFYKSHVGISDFSLIRGLAWEPRSIAYAKAKGLAAESAQYILDRGEMALEDHETLVVATHVPPFRACATYQGEQSDDDWAPWMTSKAMGDVLVELADKFEEKKILVLCGHSHGGSDVTIRPNLRVITGEARYKRPVINGTFEF